MTSLNSSDFAPYLVAFKEKYGHDYGLPVESIEEIILEGEDDNVDAVIEGMEIEESEAGIRDRLPAKPRVIDDSMGSPYSYAIKFDAAFERDIEVLAKAAIENKRGAAVIMRDLFRLFGEETVTEVWPVPGSWKPGQAPKTNGAFEAEANRVWDKETGPKPGGETGTITKSFYSDLIALSARGDRLLKEKAAFGDGFVGDKRLKLKRVAAITTQLSNFKSSIVRAVSLGQRIAFCNAYTRMHCEIETEVIDGVEQVAQSNKLVYIEDKDDRKKNDIITIGQFLGLKGVVEEATYAQIVGAAQRPPKVPATGLDLLVNGKLPLERFDTVMAASAIFAEDVTNGRLRGDLKEYNALLTKLNGAGSDPLLMSMHSFSAFLDGLLSQPAFQKRIANNLQGRKTG